MIRGRRLILKGLAAGGIAGALPAWPLLAQSAPSGLVTRTGTALMRSGQPYRISGTNLWYAAWLGADNRPRLLRELDRLAAIGVNNLRIMGAAEEGPLRNSVRPGFSDARGQPVAALAEGLDFAMAEIARRGMTAVICLGNFWEWSGGMATWLYRVTGEYLDMNDPAHPWPAFPDATAAFYANRQAVALYHAHVRAIVTRQNTITGQLYADDPAILSWQLANEPRPGGSEAGIAHYRAAYLDWIGETARLIRSLDAAHLVSLGHEGMQGVNGQEPLLREAHAEIDYLTAHIWPLNWSWVNARDLAGTWDRGSGLVADYLSFHEALATDLGKPLVVEEFGFPRDGEALAAGTSTSFKNRFYAQIHAGVEASVASGGPLVGSNFWAWNGEARAARDSHRFAEGDTAYMGDPPHEPQGWYGVYDSDAETIALLQRHVRVLR